MAVDQDLLHELDARMQIEATIIRAGRGYDRCDRELILSCYHEDGWDDHGVFKGTATQFADWVIPLHQSLVWTSHYNTNIHIEVDGDEARAETYVIANLRYHEEGGQLVDLFGCGRYLDRFEKRNGKWLIAYRHAISDWSRVDPVERQAEGPITDFLVRGQRDRSDASYPLFDRSRPEPHEARIPA